MKSTIQDLIDDFTSKKS